MSQTEYAVVRDGVVAEFVALPDEIDAAAVGQGMGAQLIERPEEQDVQVGHLYDGAFTAPPASLEETVVGLQQQVDDLVLLLLDI